ncbi:hypothetical protein PanWU01x14_061380 [Parasponia andersonii]|uniref:Uncharacterized protein n=1 Tax=Parasponia andersonii TaxID=3476 RepID=A0A2P5DI50_PARAD|nr:hypothetical protein PanWU01x14_061380 [Parasponia andersonii]
MPSGSCKYGANFRFNHPDPTDAAGGDTSALHMVMVDLYHYKSGMGISNTIWVVCLYALVYAKYWKNLVRESYFGVSRKPQDF